MKNVVEIKKECENMYVKAMKDGWLMDKKIELTPEREKQCKRLLAHLRDTSFAEALGYERVLTLINDGKFDKTFLTVICVSLLNDYLEAHQDDFDGQFVDDIVGEMGFGYTDDEATDGIFEFIVGDDIERSVRTAEEVLADIWSDGVTPEILDSIWESC